MSMKEFVDLKDQTVFNQDIFGIHISDNIGKDFAARLMSPETIITKERNIHTNNIIKLNDDDIEISGYNGTDNLDVENIHIDNLYFDGDTVKVYKINNPRMENGFPSRDPGFLYIYNRYKRKRLSKMYIPNHGKLFFNPINWYADTLHAYVDYNSSYTIFLRNNYDRYANRILLNELYRYELNNKVEKMNQMIEDDSSMFIPPSTLIRYGDRHSFEDESSPLYNSFTFKTSIVIEDPDVVTQVYKTKKKTFVRTNLTKERKNRWRNLDHNEYLSPVENIFKKSWKTNLFSHSSYSGDLTQDFYINEIVFKITSLNNKIFDGFSYSNNILPPYPVEVNDRGVITSYFKKKINLFAYKKIFSYTLLPDYNSMWTERGLFSLDSLPDHFKAMSKFNIEDDILDNYLEALNVVKNGKYRPVSLYQPLIEEYMKWGNNLDENGETYVILPENLELTIQEDSKGKYIKYNFVKIKKDTKNLTHPNLGNKTLVYNDFTKRLQLGDKSEIISTDNKVYLNELNELYPELPSIIGNENFQLAKTYFIDHEYVHLDNLVTGYNSTETFKPDGKSIINGSKYNYKNRSEESYYKGLELMYKITYYHFNKVASPELKSLFGEGLRKMALFNKVYVDKELKTAKENNSNIDITKYTENMKKFSINDFIDPNNVDYEKLMNNPKKLHFMDMMKNGFDGNNSDDIDKKMKWSQWTEVYYPNSNRHKYSDDGWEHEVNALDIASYYMENLNINNLEKKITSKKTREIENVFYGIFGSQGVKNIHTFDEALFKPGYFYVPHDRLGSGVNYQKGSFFTPTNNNKKYHQTKSLIIINLY